MAPCNRPLFFASDRLNRVTGPDTLADGGHTLPVWRQPLTRTAWPPVSPEDEMRGPHLLCVDRLHPRQGSSAEERKEAESREGVEPNTE
jgi:hypothetical protein